MSIIKIETGVDNPILRAKSKDVKKIDKKIKKFIDDMIDTLNSKDGLGLAAPQVGVNKRIIIVRFNYDSHEEMIMPMINPVIVGGIHLGKVSGEEGCLSLPGVYKPVDRWKKIRVKFADTKENINEFELEGLNARIVQHEIDHLDGILFVDIAEGNSTENDMSMITM